jgi:hypothetical protein
MRYCSTEEPVVGGGGRELEEASKSKNLQNIA